MILIAKVISDAPKKYADEEGLDVNITIFEKSGRVGGRTLTVDAFHDPFQPIELGASIFVTINQILYNSSLEFELSISEPYDSEKGDITAIWDGQKFVYESTEGSSFWWDLVKLWWRYGTSPYRAVKLVQSVVGKFLQLYEPPYFPFRSLTQRAFELGLTKVTAVTGEQFLAENNIDHLFAHDIIQAATRVNYASNLAYIHGLETMVSFSTDGAVAVKGGNWQIFDQMVRNSYATLNLNTSVASITLAEKEGEKKYLISSKISETKAIYSEDHGVEFDNVIVTSPWQFSHIHAGEGVLQHTIDKIPYTKLHVTLFTSPLKLHGDFFGLAPGAKVPSSVFTTLGDDDEPKQGAEAAGSAGFFSISTLKTVVNPKTGKHEYAYKIFSPEAVTSKFLSKLLGTEIPDTFVSASSEDHEDGEVTFEPITWFHPWWFYAYPVELPRVTFQDPIVGQGLYYTSGIESFISTMETSALMGKNVARLIADDFAGISREEVGTSYRGKMEDVKEKEPGLKAQEPGEL
ncbi:Fc.00g016260.m01.CDS01 [Cosmosporella sp. VM-42]